MRPRVEDENQRLERTVLSPLRQTGTGYYVFILFLLAIVAWGFYAYITQIYYGLVVTGMRDIVMWGLYLVNFVFFIGISHAGTLISAILRVTNAGWRTPITRMAELITVVAISIGALMPVIDLGWGTRSGYGTLLSTGVSSPLSSGTSSPSPLIWWEASFTCTCPLSLILP